MIRLLCLAVALICCRSVSAQADYAVAITPAPVLNTPDFANVFGGKDGKTLATDRCGQVRALEFMALPGTVFRVLGPSDGNNSSVLRVSTKDYPTPAGGSLYLDRRFVELHKDEPLPRKPRLPAAEQILSRLRQATGSPYVWGGNVQAGIPQLLPPYFPATRPAEASRLTLAGLDCSGLLYQATDGWTPRNTSQLLSFGAGVAIAGQRAETIARLLRPLDLIVWNGHVLIILDRENIVESRLECHQSGHGGVVITPLLIRLREIMRTRQPADYWDGEIKEWLRKHFVVRRWYPE